MKEHTEECDRENDWREHIGALPKCVCPERKWPDDYKFNTNVRPKKAKW